jgi:hypothetical protein
VIAAGRRRAQAFLGVPASIPNAATGGERIAKWLLEPTNEAYAIAKIAGV